MLVFEILRLLLQLHAGPFDFVILTHKTDPAETNIQ